MEKIWLQSYEAGVPAEIDISRYESIISVFEESVQKYGAQTAFENMGKGLSYAELAQQAQQFASFLQNTLKLPRGERVAVMLPNVLQYPIAIFGILQAGLVVVNTNPLYTPRELEHQLNDSGATTIIVLENFANTLELVLPKTQIKNVIVATIGDMFGALKGALMNFVIRKIKKWCPTTALPARFLSNKPWRKARRRLLCPWPWRAATPLFCNTPAAPPAWPKARCSATAISAPI
jgi:long-chain acyl-CoA synthetase